MFILGITYFPYVTLLLYSCFFIQNFLLKTFSLICSKQNKKYLIQHTKYQSTKIIVSHLFLVGHTCPSQLFCFCVQVINQVIKRSLMETLKEPYVVPFIDYKTVHYLPYFLWILTSNLFSLYTYSFKCHHILLC